MKYDECDTEMKGTPDVSSHAWVAEFWEGGGCWKGLIGLITDFLFDYDNSLYKILSQLNANVAYKELQALKKLRPV